MKILLLVFSACVLNACKGKEPKEVQNRHTPSAADTTKIGCGCPVFESVKKDTNGDTIFRSTTTDPVFLFGSDSLAHFLSKNIDPAVPKKQDAPAGIYTAIVQLVVGKNGNVNQMTALTKNGYGMEKEVVRVARKIKKMNPAILNGRRVAAYRYMSFRFKVE
ncbi:MAG: energy transducer TonB [Niabella sp.]|nr:energy transducer TonB [Niabella sp.]